jgi:hypothetical protein
VTVVIWSLSINHRKPRFAAAPAMPGVDGPRASIFNRRTSAYRGQECS